MTSAPAHAGALLFQVMASEDRRFNEILSACGEMCVQPVGSEGQYALLGPVRFMVDEVVQSGPQLECHVTAGTCSKTLRPLGERNLIVFAVHHQQGNLDLCGARKRL